MKKLFVLLPLVLMLAACGEESNVKKAVRATLIDPDSGIYGEFNLIGKDAACITVNAKNTFGGYTGDKELFLKKVNGTWIVGSTKEVSHLTCIKEAQAALAEAEAEGREHKRVASEFEPKILKLGMFTTNVQSENSDRMIQADIRVKVISQDIETKITELNPEIKAKVLALIASKNGSELETPEQQKILAKEIKSLLELILGLRTEDLNAISAASSAVSAVVADSAINSDLKDVIFESFYIM